MGSTKQRPVLEDCPHLASLKNLPASAIKADAPCADCSSTRDNWMCLDCYTVHCSQGVNKHALLHHESTDHPLCLGFKGIAVYCYVCKARVDNPKLYPARNAAHLSRFCTVLPWTYSTKNPFKKPERVQDTVTECPHLWDYFKHVSSSEIDIESPCEVCSYTGDNWLCLKCYTVHCERKYNRHTYVHAHGKKHPLILNFKSNAVWCFGCHAYVDNPRFYDVRNTVHVIKYNTRLPRKFIEAANHLTVHIVSDE